VSLIYLDSNATTQVDPTVLEAIKPFLEEHYGNPSSAHTFGASLKGQLDEARTFVQNLIGAKSSSEIIFTSGATESNNLIFQSILKTYPTKRHFVISSVEHHSISYITDALAKEGCEVSVVPVDETGQLNLQALEQVIREDTGLVSIMWVNNETGVVFPMEKIAELVKSKGALLHVDGVQAVGKLEMDVEGLGIDLLSLSGHKFHAPKGIGVLYKRQGITLKPTLFGGGQESGLRPGTENVVGIIGLGVAARLAQENLEDEKTRVREMRDKLEKRVREIPHTLINGSGAERIPNTLNVSFKGIEGEALLLRLDELGIFASSGSACAAETVEPSHVLKAMHLTDEEALSSVRFSLSRFNTESEIDKVGSLLPELVEELRAISTI